MSQNEWKTTEIRASKVGNFSPFSCPGDLYVTREGATTRVSAPFEPSTRMPTFDQYAASVNAVSSFWPSSKDVENGEGVLYPRWHPNQILGPRDAPDAWGDSDRGGPRKN